MNKIMFNLIKGISYKLDDLCVYIADEGRSYEEYKMLFHIIDGLSTKIYSFGYNTFVLTAK